MGTFVITLGRHLSPALFWPRPKVESAVVHMVRRPDLASLEWRRQVNSFAARLLRHRRKTLRRMLADMLQDGLRADELLARQGLEGSVRADCLELSALEALARAGLTDS